MFTSSVVACFIIVRVSLPTKKWRILRTLPRGMSYNFSEAVIRRGRGFEDSR